jgi:hypothetical protein
LTGTVTTGTPPPIVTDVFDAGLFDAGLFDTGLFDTGLFDTGVVVTNAIFDSPSFWPAYSVVGGTERSARPVAYPNRGRRVSSGRAVGRFTGGYFLRNLTANRLPNALLAFAVDGKVIKRAIKKPSRVKTTRLGKLSRILRWRLGRPLE